MLVKHYKKERYKMEERKWMSVKREQNKENGLSPRLFNEKRKCKDKLDPL